VPLTTQTDEELDELCRLLLGTDRQRLLQALERIEQKGKFTELQSRTLGDAMRLALARDPAFADSMGALIGKGVHATVQRDSAAFGRALAPAMGPAIRNAVTLMLQGFVQSIESVVDQRLSLKSLRWRWQAWRSGRTFAEVAFVHTLLFRVEHVFLVHGQGGVQLLHATPPGVTSHEPELISAMLTAIQDFVRDAFDAPQGDTLTQFAVGELTVVIETGSHAVLAAVVRGQTRPDIRRQLRDSLDRIETTMGQQLAEFAGSIDEFEVVRPDLEACLLRSQLPSAAARKSPTRGLVLRALLTASALGLLAWGAVAWFEAHKARQTLDAFVAALQAEPGFVLLGPGVDGDPWHLRGLRDPLARRAEALAIDHGVDGRVQLAFEPYVALHPTLVLQRAQRALAPPPTATLALEQGHLQVRGAAGHRWRRHCLDTATLLPGIESVSVDDLEDTDLTAWQAARDRLHDPWSLDELHTRRSTPRAAVELLQALFAAGDHLERPTTVCARLLLRPGDDAVQLWPLATEVLAALSADAGVRIELLAERDSERQPTLREPSLRFEATFAR
jgi:OOP family OmpA-OmpF porin